MPRGPGTLQAPRRGPSREERERDRKRDYDARRGSSSARGYGSRWQKARLGYLRKHPLCVEHLRRGEVVAATDLDHIVPHRGDKGLFWDRSNWQPLCKVCHSRKTAREDGGFGNDGEGGSNL